jgi:predicted protein tyrosine phosphatase
VQHPDPNQPPTDFTAPEDIGAPRPRPWPNGLTPFRVTICGIDELPAHGARGVTHVLSLLDPDWPPLAAFGLYAPHRRLELRFNDVIDPRPGYVMPERADVEQLLAFGRDLAATPSAHLLVHCHAGVSRSTAAAIVIVTQARPRRPAADAVRAVVAYRPRAWPNLRIIELGDELLGAGGEVVAAVAAHYRAALRRDPWLADTMTEAGRAREVALAGTASSS